MSHSVAYIVVSRNHSRQNFPWGDQAGSMAIPSSYCDSFTNALGWLTKHGLTDWSRTTIKPRTKVQITDQSTKHGLTDQYSQTDLPKHGPSQATSVTEQFTDQSIHGPFHSRNIYRPMSRTYNLQTNVTFRKQCQTCHQLLTITIHGPVIPHGQFPLTEHIQTNVTDQ